MRAIRCKAWGDPSTLSFEEVASPALGPGQLRLAVHAAGINFADTLMIAGKYQEKPPFPFTPGIEAAGIVSEVAPDVTSHKPGDRVMAVMVGGAFAEEAVVAANQAYRIPDSMDLATAAGFMVAYGTSHMALRQRADLKRGETLLVNGASSGVGLTAVEIGKAMGAGVIATASSADKLAVAREHGADHLIDYSREDVRERVKALTGGKGADVIYDPVGGDAFDAALRSIAWGGRLLVIGFASGRIPQAPANYILIKNCAVMGVLWGLSLRRDPGLGEAGYKELFAWWSAGKLKPFISRKVPLEKTAEALALMMQRKVTGKIVLTTGRGE
jgi:NADPH2:quinone reductase